MNYKVKKLYRVKVYDTYHTIAAEDIEQLIAFVKDYFATKGQEPSVITAEDDYILVVEDDNRTNEPVK